MKRKAKILISCALTLCAYTTFSQIQHAYLKKTDGFSLEKITSSLEFHNEWVLPPLELEEQRELQLALSQPYRYLGSGGQCFAFVSEDDRYVVKFFKHHRRKPPLYAKLPLPSLLKKKAERSTEKRHTKLLRDFTSYKLAMLEMKQETGLIFVHLNKTRNLRHSLTLTDKIGRSCTVDLDDKEFVVQRKAQMIYPTLISLMERGDEKQAEYLLSSILHLIISRSQKGLIDEDADIERNFGCIGNKAILIDAGRLHYDASIADPKNTLLNIYKVTGPFIAWLHNNYPELKLRLEETISELEKNTL